MKEKDLTVSFPDHFLSFFKSKIQYKRQVTPTKDITEKK